jgi:crotonobetainyl-CoA:carnitine CoA-transferase CaiB-like acyl-CoA transferase
MSVMVDGICNSGADPQRFPGRPGGRGLSSIGYIPVRTKDGIWLQHANQRVPHIQGHLKAIGLGHLLEDERFKSVPAISVDNRELLRREICEAVGENRRRVDGDLSPGRQHRR